MKRFLIQIALLIVMIPVISAQDIVEVSMIGFLILLLVAAVCGSIGAAIAGSSYRGCLTNIVLGFIGAIIGRWLSQEIGISDFIYFHNIPIIWTIVGAALFVAVINLLVGDKNR